MRPRNPIVISVIKSLLAPLIILVGGCVWIPDFEDPSPNPALKYYPTASSSIRHMSFSLTRAVSVDKDEQMKGEFRLEKDGRMDWFDHWGLGTTATYWRFVLFGPDGSIICGNEWEPSSIVSKVCTLKKEYLGSPLSADIDYTYESKSPSHDDPFMTMSRSFYFVEK
jgi:hypothetical protein